MAVEMNIVGNEYRQTRSFLKLTKEDSGATIVHVLMGSTQIGLVFVLAGFKRTCGFVYDYVKKKTKPL